MLTISKHSWPRNKLDRHGAPETRGPNHNQDEMAFAAELRRLIHTSNGLPAVHQLAELGPIWEPHLALSAALRSSYITSSLTSPDRIPSPSDRPGRTTTIVKVVQAGCGVRIGQREVA